MKSPIQDDHYVHDAAYICYFSGSFIIFEVVTALEKTRIIHSSMHNEKNIIIIVPSYSHDYEEFKFNIVALLP